MSPFRPVGASRSVELFIGAMPAAHALRWRAGRGLAETLDELVRSGRAAWPDLPLTDAAFLTRLAACAGDDADPPAALARLRAGDLWLAAACLAGVPGAIQSFEASHGSVVDEVHARFRNPPIDRDELRQAVRQRLFVAENGAPPRIGTYEGRGTLASWLRMLATRLLLDEARRHGARPDLNLAGDLPDVATPIADPELAFLEQTYRVEFRAAFAEAVGRLTPRDRNLLRHRYLDGLEVGKIATLYGMHRGSMSRALSRIQASLLGELRDALLRRIAIDGDELDSLLALVRSRLDVSLSALLRD
jgi:RNA polymerase sigma-70 factor (ECF subfamily)